jgi:hypothetical protein
LPVLEQAHTLTANIEIVAEMLNSRMFHSE